MTLINLFNLFSKCLLISFNSGVTANFQITLIWCWWKLYVRITHIMIRISIYYKIFPTSSCESIHLSHCLTNISRGIHPKKKTTTLSRSVLFLMWINNHPKWSFIPEIRIGNIELRWNWIDFSLVIHSQRSKWNELTTY
jgi:hypothetical protein